MHRTFPALGLFALLLTACATEYANVDVDSHDDSSSVSSYNQSSSPVVRQEPIEVVASSSESISSAGAMKAVPTTEADWKEKLTPEQYYVLREAGTERPFTSPLLHEKRKGTYVSADCDEPLFRSEQKYDSGTGWPSFWAPISEDAVVEIPDRSLGVLRVEVQSKCGGHLGHVFTDGPEPTGLRYCMNGDALKFIPDAEQ